MEVTRMYRCEHVFRTKGKFFNRKRWVFGGELFTVFRYRECTQCQKKERKVVMKKITATGDTYERQLKFSGIKPENQID
jgi:hypothetical protein